MVSFRNRAVTAGSGMIMRSDPTLMADVLVWIVLREPVRAVTWVAIAVAIGGIAIMVADTSGGVALKGSLARFDRYSVLLSLPWRCDGAAQRRRWLLTWFQHRCSTLKKCNLRNRRLYPLK
jgi:hypothetical protein